MLALPRLQSLTATWQYDKISFIFSLTMWFQNSLLYGPHGPGSELSLDQLIAEFVFHKRPQE